ncbi:MAG: hypothetical protein MJZ15_01250 [Bacteroidales bacterium]|nr:hypothetical protein [Bacteroidales bacterium]
MKRIFLIAFLCLLYVCETTAQFAEVTPTFEGSTKLDKPYGICAHVTFPGRENYDARIKTLELASDIGVNFIRSDMLSTLFYKNGMFNSKTVDVLANDFKTHNISLLPLLDRHVVGVYGWRDVSLYTRYVDSLITRYPQYDYWEVMNEVDLISNEGTQEDLALKYLSVIKEVCKVVHKHGKKVVFGGIARANGTLAKTFLENGGAEYIDVYNFHSYSSGVSPESFLYSDLNQLSSRLDRTKEVWVTETGYHTEEPSRYMSQFFCNILPRALSKVNVNEGDTIAVIKNINEQFIGYLSTYKYHVRYIDFDEIDKLDAKHIRALIPCDGEKFPIRFYSKLLSYVRDGGTIILPYGVPFYYDVTSDGKVVQCSGEYRNKLRMFFEFWWEASFKSSGLPKNPTVVVKNPDYADLKCSWVSNGDGTTRYVSGRFLKDGDSLEPIISVGDSSVQAPICGIIHYGSDLKGKCIFNTYLGEIYSVSEILKAKRLSRSYIYGLSMGLSKIFWYELRNGGTNKYEPEHHFGIVDIDNSPLPAYEAYKNIVKMMPDGSTRPELNYDNNRKVYKASWKRPDKKVVDAYWTTQSEVKIAIKKKRSTKVYDYVGNEISVRNNMLDIDNGVVYVVRRR